MLPQAPLHTLPHALALLQEASLMAGLRHPNIVQVGIHARCLPCILPAWLACLPLYPAYSRAGCSLSLAELAIAMPHSPKLAQNCCSLLLQPFFLACFCPQFLGWCAEPPCLMSEYCPRGSLHDTLRQALASPEVAQQFTWAVRLRMVSLTKCTGGTVACHGAGAD
jgi:hypothetical protein